MDIKELATLAEGRLRQLVGESLSIAVTPRRFLAQVSNEPPADTYLRIVVLAACYATVEIALFSLVQSGHDDWSTLRVLGVSAIEIALGIGLIPAFYVVTKYLGFTAPLRVAFAYAVTFRFVFLAVPMALMAVFLLSEDYTVAFFKGLAVWAFLLSFVLALPISGARTRRQRLVASGISVALSGLIMVAVAQMHGRFEGLGGRHMPTLLGDPIGDEVDEARFEWRYVGAGSSMGEFLSAWNALIDAKREGDMLIGPPGLKKSVAVVGAWPKRYGQQDSLWAEEIARLTKVDSSATFATTRKLARANVLALKAARTAGKASLRFLQPVASGNVADFYKAYIQAMDAQIAAGNQDFAYAMVRTKLIRWMLLECTCETAADTSGLNR